MITHGGVEIYDNLVNKFKEGQLGGKGAVEVMLQ